MKIDVYSELTSDEVIILYWFYRCHKSGTEGYENFKITQSLINEFNELMERWEKKYSSNYKYRKVVNWDVDRKKTEYYETQLNIAHQFEIYIDKQFKKNGINLGAYSDTRQYEGENEYGIEIKNDIKNLETGNFYIEYQERLNDEIGWTDSGILKNDNTKYFLLGNERTIAIFKKQTLLDIYHKLISKTYVDGCLLVRENAHQTSKGFIILKEKLNKYIFASSVEEFIKKVEEENNGN